MWSGHTDVEFVAGKIIQLPFESLNHFLSMYVPMVIYSLDDEANVGLTVVTSSFMIFFTIVVLPALSSPLPFISHVSILMSTVQHQNPHLLVIQSCFPQNRKHLVTIVALVQPMLLTVGSKSRLRPKV